MGLGLNQKMSGAAWDASFGVVTQLIASPRAGQKAREYSTGRKLASWGGDPEIIFPLKIKTRTSI